MIHAENIRVSYDGRKDFVFSVPKLEISAGECVVICGRSGCGKTTLIRLLNGLIPEYFSAEVEGTLTIGGESILEKSVEELSYKVGTVFQNPATQFFHRKVEDELVFPCENQGIATQDIQTRLVTVTELLQLADELSQDLLQLSGGRRQRVAIATAMMQQPQVLLLDEPTANLDEKGIVQITAAIEQIKTLGITILISEHRLHFLTDVADRYVYFEDGKLTNDWMREEFLQLSIEERKQLGLRSRTLKEAWKRIETIPEVSGQDGLAFKMLELGYHKRNPLYAVPPVTISSGKVTGILGDNGTGKSTFLKTIAGLQKSLQGQIRLNGEILTKKQLQKQTAFVMQETRLQLVSPTVEEEITLGTTKNSTEISEALGLSAFLKEHPLALSGGQIQRVMIANALLQEKTVYLFDEPTSGLDYGQMIEVSHLLQQLAQKGNIVIVVTHDVELIASCCDEVMKF